MMRGRTGIALAVAALSLCSIPRLLPAQTYPQKPVRLVVPFPPGGGIDAVARTIAQPLTESLGYQVIVDNRSGGASGRIGTELVAKSAPDGYTLLMASNGPNAIVPAAYKNLAYDGVRDFTPISLVASTALVFVIHPIVPVKSVTELIAFARSKPGALTFATTGNGSGGHLAMELFKSMTGAQLTHIPYKGAGPALNDVVGGQVAILVASLPSVTQHVQSGRLRALGVTGLQRAATFPDVPAISEFVSGYEAINWYGVMAPAGTPANIVARLHEQIMKALRRSEVQKRLSGLGADLVGSTPAQFAATIKSDIAKWSTLIKQAVIQFD